MSPKAMMTLRPWLVCAWLLLAATPANAFHNGGVAACEGCHTIHNSQDGSVMTAGAGETGVGLILAPDPSSICLKCHAGEGATTVANVFSADGSALTPGGDFYWLRKSFAWTTGSSFGPTHGHNIVSRDYGLAADPYRDTAPFGSYPSASLSCISCHNPHGRTSHDLLPISGSGSYGEPAPAGTVRGNYRLLGGIGYDGGDAALNLAFSNNPPVARQNILQPFGESEASHVDYGSGMSEWCTNCHTTIIVERHQNGASAFEHPVGNDAGLGDYVDAYNRYVSTGTLSGTRATAYLALVPFERRVVNPELLDPTGSLGPDINSNVMCLTCHRAHASAFPFAGRWDFFAELVADSHPAATDAGVTGNDVAYSYYGRDMLAQFGFGQRNLCEKCHAVPKEGYPVFPASP